MIRYAWHFSPQVLLLINIQITRNWTAHMHVHGRLQATCSRPSAACTHTRWWCHQGVIKYYLRGMCSNSNVWLETRTQSSPAIRGHARTSNHHPSKKYLTTTTVRGHAWRCDLRWSLLACILLSMYVDSWSERRGARPREGQHRGIRTGREGVLFRSGLKFLSSFM